MPTNKEAEPQSPSSSSKPGAQPDSGSSRRSSGKERERKERSSGASSSDRDRNAKSRARTRSNDAPSTPGAHSSTSASPRSGKHKSSDASSKRDRSAKSRAKRPANTPAAPGAYSTRDSGKSSRKERSGGASSSSSNRDRNAKMKIKSSSSNVPNTPGAHLSSSSGKTADDRISRKTRRHENKSSAATNDPTPHQDVPSAYQIEGELANVDDRNEQEKQSAVAAASSQELQDNQDDESSSPPRRRRWRKIIVALLLLVGGALAAFFLTRSKEPSPVSAPEAATSDTAMPSASGSPSSFESNSPSSFPTFVDLYEPPDPDLCIQVSKNQTTPEDRAGLGLEQVDFGLTIDATLDVDGDMTNTQVFSLVQALQEKLAPDLLGCSETNRRNLLETGESTVMIRGGVVPHHQNRRKLVLGGANRYIIADAYAKGKEIEDECTKTQSKPQCHRVFVELTVFLKNPIRLLDIAVLISEKVDELEEEGDDDFNLKKPLSLEYPFFNVQFVKIGPLSPTAAPSMMPTNVPSISASPLDVDQGASSPMAPEPVLEATTPPTSMLVDEGAPTAAPEKEPTASPVDGPAPSADPSLAPSGALSLNPTVAPVSGPTPPPTSRPTMAPSVTPSLEPTLVASGAPSLAPVAGPSPPPSAGPSRFPSVAPSSKPTVTASGSPSWKPSASPSAKPSAKPSASPSASPSVSPSKAPSPKPSEVPSPAPSSAPSNRCFCLTTNACTGTDLDRFTIGCDSCDVDNSCDNLQTPFSAFITGSTIGERSCTVARSCTGATVVRIGDNSCTADRSCRARTSFAIGNDSCTGQYSCDFLGDNFLGASVGGITVGDESCTDTNGCLSYSGTVGDGSCQGDSACQGRDVLDIGNGSCTEANSCDGLDRLGYIQNPVPSLTVGEGSCTCEKCVQTVGDGQCTAFSSFRNDRSPGVCCFLHGDGTIRAVNDLPSGVVAMPFNYY